jgi:hypothetical protein
MRILDKNMNRFFPFLGNENSIIFAPPEIKAEVAQLVERNLAKVEVASSRLVFRSLKRLLVNGYLLLGRNLPIANSNSLITFFA